MDPRCSNALSSSTFSPTPPSGPNGRTYAFRPTLCPPLTFPQPLTESPGLSVAASPSCNTQILLSISKRSHGPPPWASTTEPAPSAFTVRATPGMPSLPVHTRPTGQTPSATPWKLSSPLWLPHPLCWLWHRSGVSSHPMKYQSSLQAATKPPTGPS